MPTKNDHILVLAGQGKGDLPLEVHVILPADDEPPLKPVTLVVRVLPLEVTRYERMRETEKYQARLLLLSALCLLLSKHHARFAKRKTIYVSNIGF